MLIDIGYFTKGDRRIMNATSAQTMGQNSAAVKSVVDGYIEQYQPIYLRKALGKTLAEEIESYQTIPASLQPLVDQIKEPLAEFVFFHIIRDGNNTATINGMIEIKNAENSTIAPIRAMVRSWNRMVAMHECLYDWAKSQPYAVFIQAEMLTPINELNV